MFNGNNGWDNQGGYCQQPNSNTHYTVVIDLAAVLQEHSRGMLLAYEMGRDARNVAEQERRLGIERQQLATMSLGYYMGVFDQGSYGVYIDQEALDRSEPYWDKATLQMQGFKTADEALSYARNGVARLRQIDISMVPEMQHPVNWRQKV